MERITWVSNSQFFYQSEKSLERTLSYGWKYQVTFRRWSATPRKINTTYLLSRYNSNNASVAEKWNSTRIRLENSKEHTTAVQDILVVCDLYKERSNTNVGRRA